MKWFLTIFAILALAVGIAGPVVGAPWAASLMTAFGFVGLLIAANLDRISEFKASKSGTEARTRTILNKAEVTIEQLQIIAKTVAGLSLSLVQRSGRFGGFSDVEQNQVYNDTLGALSKIGIQGGELAEITRDWHRVVDFDYAFFVLGGHTVPEKFEPSAIAEWSLLRGDGFEKVATPAEVRAFLTKRGLLSTRMEELVQDYEYYRANRQHRRPDVWAERSKWGRLRSEAAAG